MDEDRLVTLDDASGFSGHQIVQLMRELAGGAARRVNACNCSDATLLPDTWAPDRIVRHGHLKDFGANPDEDLALFTALVLGKPHGDIVMKHSTLYRIVGA